MNSRSAVKLNHILYAVMALILAVAEMPPDIVNILPEKWRHAVAIIVLCAAWVKSHRNLYVNPDSTPAQAAWDNSNKKDTQ